MSGHSQILGGDEDDHDDLCIVHDDGDAEMIERSPAIAPMREGYSDDPEMRREMHHKSHYMPNSQAVSFMKLGCYIFGFLAVLISGYFIGKSSNEKIDSVMGKIPGSGSLMAASSSPESDFASVDKLGNQPPEEKKVDRMELLRASIGESTLTLDDILRDPVLPNFPSTINISNLSDTDKLLFTFLAKYPFARDYVVELVMDDYTTPESPWYDAGHSGKISARLDHAFEAMELYEVDYKPVQIKNHPFMFVGSVGASLSEGTLKKKKITHIVNWSALAKCNLYKKDIEYMCMDGFKTQSDLKSRLGDLDAAVEFVEHVRKEGGKVLIHDWYGTGFSATHSAAYMMKYENMPVKVAIALIQETRPDASPYAVALDSYGQKYLS